MCGLIKRDTLDDVDIGFAFLPAFRAQGYAHEAASAVLAYGKRRLRADAHRGDHVARITRGSARLLEKLGMTLEKTVKLAGADHEVRLYASGA